jgi:diacylglycerol kinase (ATP)
MTYKKGIKMSKKDKSIRVKLIANPNAGNTSDGIDKLELVKDYLKKNGLKIDVVLAGPEEKATSIACRAVNKGYKTIIVMGNDSIIEAVMRGMVGSKVRLGIIPIGEENHISKSLDIPQKLEDACDLIVSNNTIKLDMGQVKTRKGKKFIFFENVTIGLPAAIYHDATRVTINKLSRLEAIATTFTQQKNKPTFFLTFNGENKIEAETMVVMVSNASVSWKNSTVPPKVSLQDGLLDVYTYPDFSGTELLGYYAAMMDGGYSGNAKVQHYQVNKLKVKTSPKLEVIIDGTALCKGRVTIKVCPRALRIITAKKSPNLKNIRGDATETIVPKPVSLKSKKQHLLKSTTLSR